jgi:hypothetical protein
MTFEEYLISKKIDQQTFQLAEPRLFDEWRAEFEQVHPNSFTAQKLYLINPIRRKYILKQEPAKIAEITERKTEEVKPIVEMVDPPSITVQQTSLEEKSISTESKPLPSPSKPARPVFKPKPKIN